MMETTRKRGLGRGLEALIPIAGERRDGAVPQMVPVDQVRPSDQQVRRSFEPEALNELADSIRTHGLLQPILVRRLPDGYQLIAGERRWRAARLAGVERVPALVREAGDDEQRLVLGLVENLQREELNPIEEAHGIKLLIERHGLTQEEVAERLGRNRVSVAHALRLLNATAAVQSATANGMITAGHARALAGLPDAAAQEHGLKVVIARRLSVRQCENWVKRYAPPRRARRAAPARGGLESLERDLQIALGLSVRITGGNRRGTIAITYRTPEELEAVVARLGG
jgi:ParB family chromosome partitioning protein